MAASSRSVNARAWVTLCWDCARTSPLISFLSALMARFFYGMSRTPARNSSPRIDMSRLSISATRMMSTISVETTAQFTICWMAKSRSAVVLLPSPGALLTKAARIAWKKPIRLVGRGSRHYDLDAARVVVLAVPVRPQRHDGAVERHADVPAHADDHGLAVQRGQPGLEVPHLLGSRL